jgi:NADPH-dependent curcumin reductase CurA
MDNRQIVLNERPVGKVSSITRVVSERAPHVGDAPGYLPPIQARTEGFIILDYSSRSDEARAELAAMVESGALHHQEHIVKGIERAPEALNHFFRGVKRGETLVQVDESVLLG